MRSVKEVHFCRGLLRLLPRIEAGQELNRCPLGRRQGSRLQEDPAHDSIADGY